MNKNGEVILIDDDTDDRELFLHAYKELGIKNHLRVFNSAIEAYDYFNTSNQELFLIIADINMPQMTGIELRDKMQQVGAVNLRTIPFLFLTTGTAEDNLIYAYSHSVQGFFLKPGSYTGLKDIINNIFSYWKNCSEPVFSNRYPSAK